jgi:hypothetical protein
MCANAIVQGASELDRRAAENLAVEVGAVAENEAAVVFYENVTIHD